MTGDDQVQKKVNVRKVVIDDVLRILEGHAEGMQVSRDLTNPYVIVIAAGGKRFKVRFKEG